MLNPMVLLAANSEGDGMLSIAPYLASKAALCIVFQSRHCGSEGQEILWKDLGNLSTTKG